MATPGTVIPSGMLIAPSGALGGHGRAGLAGPNVVSADSGNFAALGSDSLVYVRGGAPSGLANYTQSGMVPAWTQRRQIHDDFSYHTAQISANQFITVAPIPWYLTVSGGATGSLYGNSYGADPINQAYGIRQLYSGTTPSTYAVLASPSPMIITGLGALDLYLRFCIYSAVPNITDNFLFYFGLSDALASGITNYISLVLTSSSNIAGWHGSAMNAGTLSSTTQVTSPTPVQFSPSALTYFNWHIAINAAWTSVSFYVNGKNIGALTANIPAAGLVLYPWLNITKNYGTSTTPQVFLDDFFLDYQCPLPGNF